MKITTSYFSSKAPQQRKVSIAKWSPRYFTGLRATKLAPSNPKAENWKQAYLQDLEQRFPKGQGLLEYLQEIEKKVPEAILCCYEKEEEECHRRILAWYVKEYLGMDILEWQAPEQGTLLK